MLKVDQNSVEARPATDARFRPADFGSGEAIARGAENIGQGLNQAAETIDKIDQQYDEAAVKQADSDDLKQIMDIKAQALSATGFDAQTAVANARQQINDIRKQRMATLSNGRQQRLYADVFDSRNLQVEESFSNHLVKQVSEANKNAATARADTYSADAVTSYGTPEFEKSLATAEGEVATVNQGAGPDVIGLAQRKLRSQVYSSVIDNMLTDPSRVQEAKETYAQHSKDLLPEDETSLLRKLNPLLEEDQTETDAGWAFTNSPTSDQPDPLAPKPAAETPDTPPRASLTGPSTHAAPIVKPISPDDPTRGAGRLTNTAAQHRARGSGNALDIAAPAGTPIYAPMSGKVIKNWWSKEGGWSVLIEHPNGYVTGYAHMRSQSPLREGSAVEPTIPIGSIGMTGEKATGPHVHYTVRLSAAGPKVDPDAVDWGKTVDPKSVSWKEPGPVKYEADENSLGRALDRLYQRAQSENWSNRRYQSAVARVRQISGVQEQLYSQQQDAQWKTAEQTIVNLGDKLTSRTQIPGFGQLDPGRQLQIDGIIKSNLNPTEEGKANGPQYLSYIRESYENRPQFMKDDRFITDPNITNGERARLYERRLELNQDPEGHLNGNMNEAQAMANRFLPKDFADKGRFMDRYLEAIEAKQKTLGRPLSDPEKLDAARALTVEAVRYGPHGENYGKGYLFQTIGEKGQKANVDIPDVYSRIAPATRDAIIARLKQDGRPTTPRTVVEVYLQTAR